MAFEDELKRILDTAFAELTALSSVDRDAARKEGLDRGRELGWEDGREQGRFEGRQEAEEEARTAIDRAVSAALAEVASDLAATERLVDAIRTLDRCQSLGEILETLAGCAAREADRAGVLLVRGERLQAFKFVGLDLPEKEFPLESSGLIDAAIRSRTMTTAEAGGDPAPPAFATLDAGHACLATPVVVAGEAVAVLYADQQGTAQSRGTKSWPEALEILARHAAKCLESLTAMKAARAMSGVPVAATRSAADAEDADTSAQRFAKLLVSEIKLYHEPAVAAGQRERDLASRLGGEIARARVLYEERVPAAVRQRRDYFHDELVRTLANGDATLLQLT